MRLCLAALVLFSHSFPLTGRQDEWFATMTGHTTGGGIAVAGFFVISGFLVTGSLGERDWRRYANHRVLRLVSAMAVMSFLCAFLLGPFVTNLSLSEYFARGGTWKFLENALLWPVRLTLPGVFLDHPITAMNGSVWTIPLEATMYVVLPALVLLGLTSKRVAWCLPLVMLAAALLLEDGLLPVDPDRQFLWSLNAKWLIHYGFYFAAGVFLHVYRHDLPRTPLLAVLLLATAIAWPESALGRISWRLGLAYAVFCVAFAGMVGWTWLRRNDLSYGVYLYAFPVQQCWIEWLGVAELTEISLFVLSLPVTLLLAWGSWHWVERPAMRWGRRGESTPRDNPVRLHPEMEVSAQAE